MRVLSCCVFISLSVIPYVLSNPGETTMGINLTCPELNDPEEKKEEDKGKEPVVTGVLHISMCRPNCPYKFTRGMVAMLCFLAFVCGLSTAWTISSIIDLIANINKGVPCQISQDPIMKQSSYSFTTTPIIKPDSSGASNVSLTVHP